MRAQVQELSCDHSDTWSVNAASDMTIANSLSPLLCLDIIQEISQHKDGANNWKVEILLCGLERNVFTER